MYSLTCIHLKKYIKEKEPSIWWLLSR